MSHYKDELRQLVLELQALANGVDFANDPDANAKHEHWRRQAEVLNFIIDHPEFLNAQQ
jgi:hypothetical protein